MEINKEYKEMLKNMHTALECQLSSMQNAIADIEHTQRRLEALEAEVATAEKKESGAFVDRRLSSRVSNMNNYELLGKIGQYAPIVDKSLLRMIRGGIFTMRSWRDESE